MRVLVVYGSTRGGTAGLARTIAEALLEHGVETDIGAASTVDELGGYDAVIVGGALYNSRWHEDAAWFVERNLDGLRARNVWFFSSGPLDNSASAGSLAPIGHVKELAKLADIRGHMTFGGVLAKRPAGVLSSLFAWGKPGDYRDPEQIAAWVDRIASRLAEPKQVIVLPESGDADAGLTTRVLRRLAAAGDDTDPGAEDLGLDVLVDLAES